MKKELFIKKINEYFKKEINHNLKWDVKLQKGGVATYDYNKEVVYVPNNYFKERRVTAIIHEAAHLLLRHKLSKWVSPKTFESLKWGMEPFMINNSVFTMDELFAHYLTLKISRELPEKFFTSQLELGKAQLPDYSGKENKLYMFLAELSSWKIPIMLKNSIMNIINAMNNLSLIPSSERVKYILNSLKNIKSKNYEDYVKSILINPLNDVFFTFANKITKIPFEMDLERDPQILLDCLEINSWLVYEEIKTAGDYNKFFQEFNGKMKKLRRKHCNPDMIPKKIDNELNNIRREIIRKWRSKSSNIKKSINDYMITRTKYRKRINYDFDYEPYGLGCMALKINNYGILF